MGAAMTKAASGDKIPSMPPADAATAAVMDSGLEAAPAKPRRKTATKASAEKSSAKSKATKSQTKAAKPKYARPRGGEARRVADLVPEVGGTAFRKFGFIQTSVVSRWAEIVGARLAKVTQPVLIRFPTGSKAGGTLHLSICGAHAPMLQHIGPDIVESVNRFFGYAAIASVRMAHGLTPPKPPKPKAELGPVPADLSDSLRQIADPELRTVLERMAAGLSVSRDLPHRG
jgi:hypothetical protein